LRALPARRVVSLAPNVTEILYALGVGDRVVGIDKYSDYPKEAAALPKVGTDFDPSLEAIVGLRPDVVFMAKSANRADSVQALERVGVPVYVTRTDRLAELSRTLEHVGAIVGKQAEALALGARVAAEIEGVRARGKARAPVPALIVVWNEPLFAVGPQTFAGELLAAAGGQNIVDGQGPGFPTLSLERVIKRAPEVIVIGSHSDGGDPGAYWKRFGEVPAVKKGRVHVVDGNLLFRPGPRVAEGARVLAALMGSGPGPGPGPGPGSGLGSER
jgi:iron complex transport system substrate-binding protein